MILLKNFTEKQILEIILREATEELPETSKGVIKAIYDKNNGINVYFIEQFKKDIVS